jgi:pyruvate-ferredoxin/flavodoxin oxidoreductase
MGADPAQLIKAVTEAERHKGPSVIIAYTPCISHGIKSGMQDAQAEMKRAVDSGYWMLYRYDPAKEQPFTLDSKEPSMKYEDFLAGETRYAALGLTFPQNAETLFRQAAEEARARYLSYKKLAEQQ